MSLNDELWGWLGKKPGRDFTTDLSLCFKWLVPELFKANYKAAYLVMLKWITNYSNYVGIEKFKEDPALALCEAIQKLIRSK